MNERQQDQKWVEDTRAEYLRRADSALYDNIERQMTEVFDRNYKEVFGE
jgi:hypothetical protein